jgi:hypothetical protein
VGRARYPRDAALNACSATPHRTSAQMQSPLTLHSLFARFILMSAALAVLGVSAQSGVAFRHVRCASAIDLSHGVGPGRSDRDQSPDVDAIERHLRLKAGPGLILPDIHPLGLSGDGQPHDLRAYTLPIRPPFTTGT